MAPEATAAWDLPQAHVLTVDVAPADIDDYRHVNNAVYVAWLDRAAWSHSAALGLPAARCVAIDRGMAVVRTVVVYLRPAVAGDTVAVATWIIPSASRLRVQRRFQLQRAQTGETLVRAQVEYACIELSTGRPTRWPPEFRDNFAVMPEVAAAFTGLEPL